MSDVRDEQHSRYVAEKPHPQFAVDLVPGWTSALPSFLSVKAGQLPLFQDQRVTWAIQELGGVWNRSVLELGPLEAGHTYMLHLAGAASVTSIEANSLAYLRCLIVKELLRLDRARFLLGDFVEWMRTERSRYDVVFASGVLYHMVQPVEFLRLVADKADKLFLWTHYVPDAGYSAGDPWAAAITGVEECRDGGKIVTLYRRRYGSGSSDAAFCGGIHQAPAWLRRADILELLQAFGFNDLRVGHEDPNHPNGPCFAVAALR